MSNSIIDRKIGVVDSVSTNEIKGFLLDEAPKNISILEGNITFFPRKIRNVIFNVKNIFFI